MPHENTTQRRLLSHRRSPGILLGGKLDILPVSPPQHLKGVLQAFIVLRLAHQLGCGPTHDLGVLRSPDYSSRVCRIWGGRARNRGRRIKEITLKDMKMLLAFTVKTRMDTLYIWKPLPAGRGESVFKGKSFILSLVFLLQRRSSSKEWCCYSARYI